MTDPTRVDRRSAAHDARMRIRHGAWTGPTPGLANGFAQANLLVMPTELALEFVQFCLANWMACPILEVLEPGSPHPSLTAASADLRTDLPRYLVYRHGKLELETTDARPYWSGGMTAVLLGCSFSVDAILLASGIPVRHIEEGRADPTFTTSLSCHPTARLRANLLVSMRPIPEHLVTPTTDITARFVRAHGGPVHTGSPANIGIHDLATPDYGEAVTVHENEVPMFWGCGLTALAALLSAKPALLLSHKPGHMFITDLQDHELTHMATSTQGREGRMQHA